ncbi:hypothetical protein G7Y79_00023g053160 [Physcia stellaris]|nr:hypothetical protein G7Y79_00023g053160 [Physcia stellaris]
MSHSEAPEIPLHDAPQINHEAPEVSPRTPNGPDDYPHGHSASILAGDDKERRPLKAVQKRRSSVSPTVDDPGTETGSAITSSVSGKPSGTRGHTGCPASNGTTYSSHYASKFQILCNKQWSHSLNDISNPSAADLEQCMEQCALWNAANAPTSTCHVAVYKFIWTQMGRHNCWLKNVSRSAIYPAFKDVTVASGALLPL